MTAASEFVPHAEDAASLTLRARARLDAFGDVAEPFVISGSRQGYAGVIDRASQGAFKVFVRLADIRRIFWEVRRFPNTETGGDVFGQWSESGDAHVHHVVGPGPNARRSNVSFNQDLDYLRSAGAYLEPRRAFHIGDWHSHHQLGLSVPSLGDSRTCASAIASNDKRYFVLVISTYDAVLDEVRLRVFRYEDPNFSRRIDVAYDEGHIVVVPTTPELDESDAELARRLDPAVRALLVPVARAVLTRGGLNNTNDLTGHGSIPTALVAAPPIDVGGRDDDHHDDHGHGHGEDDDGRAVAIVHLPPTETNAVTSRADVGAGAERREDSPVLMPNATTFDEASQTPLPRGRSNNPVQIAMAMATAGRSSATPLPPLPPNPNPHASPVNASAVARLASFITALRARVTALEVVDRSTPYSWNLRMANPGLWTCDVTISIPLSGSPSGGGAGGGGANGGGRRGAASNEEYRAVFLCTFDRRAISPIQSLTWNAEARIATVDDFGLFWRKVVSTMRRFVDE